MTPRGRTAAEAVRSAYPAALATLIRVLGSMDAASDALHTAVERAMQRWPDDFPHNPTAWLIRAARNAAIDQVRHQRVHERHVAAVAPDLDPASPEPRADMLRLIFTCCHPMLSADSQVALALRTVIALPVEEIARAYLVAPKAMERRLTRARRALRDAQVPYEVPDASELPQRLQAACAVVVSLFDQGYSYRAEPPHRRPRLCELAIRLARVLARMFPSDPETSGVLALLLLQHARSSARSTPEAPFVSLEHQDRTLWDQAAILEGRALIERALFRGRLGPYQLQAAIAATHCAAPTFAQTDWNEIVAFYDLLVRHRPTATVHLNQAVAVAQARGPQAGLDALERLAPDHRRRLQEHHAVHAVEGHLLADLGRREDARAAFERARARCTNPVERAYLDDKLADSNPEKK